MLPLFIVALCGVGIFFFFRFLISPIPFRQTVVVVGDPVRVISFEAKNKKISTVDIPLDTVIPAALGYGKYSVRALLSLDDIDHHNGSLIVSSISNALGLPITGYVRTNRPSDGQMSLSILRRIFSFGSIPQVLMDRSHRSLSWVNWVRFVVSVRSMSVDAWHPVVISQAIIEVISPDGTAMQTLDENRLDYIIDSAFFDAGIRSEGTSVAVYNTTRVPSVGLRASRQLSRVGMQLIFVGNAEKEVKRCVVVGSDTIQKTKTAAFIREYYDCEIKMDDEIGKETGADLVVLLGTDFAARYK